MGGGTTGLVVVGVGEGGWECREGVYGLADGLGQGLGCIRSQIIGLHLGLSFPRIQSVLHQRQSQGFVLGHCATSTEGFSVGTKWWRTIVVIAS